MSGNHEVVDLSVGGQIAVVDLQVVVVDLELLAV